MLTVMHSHLPISGITILYGIMSISHAHAPNVDGMHDTTADRLMLGGLPQDMTDKAIDLPKDIIVDSLHEGRIDRKKIINYLNH